MALPDHGRLVACDRSKDTLEIAQRYYAKAGVAHKVRSPHMHGLQGLRRHRVHTTS